MNPWRHILEADEEMQVAIRAAIEVVTNIPELERCLQKAIEAIAKEKFALTEIYRHVAGDNARIINAVENDVQWKETLMEQLPIGPSQDMLRALFTLLKTRPYLGEIHI